MTSRNSLNFLDFSSLTAFLLTFYGGVSALEGCLEYLDHGLGSCGSSAVCAISTRTLERWMKVLLKNF